MPVLPLVGSTTTERPGLTSPSSSAASIIATPIRSFTDPPGLKYSSFAHTCPASPSPSRSSCTIGVLPTTAEASAPILILFLTRQRRGCRLGQAAFPTDPSGDACSPTKSLSLQLHHCRSHGRSSPTRPPR